MRLSMIPLENVVNVNYWNYSDSLYVNEGQLNTVYLRLVNVAKQMSEECESFLRYIPQGSTNSVTITFDSIDDTEEFDVIGVNPYSDDKSIWKFIIPSNKLPKSGNLKFKITEDGVDQSFIVKGIVSTELLEVGSC